ncbi:C-C motif chemokine 3 isoform X3 [Ictalurus punctatus]|uniref:C-C motif chemokine 3 isoform X3 n=1 Tax=Ictalurus punctatus TaxID=7998 RepID=A0A9F7TLG3_ICTPU|nr:C-C motif chemokine 3 isoform X3 [Ictalurus punctatus]
MVSRSLLLVLACVQSFTTAASANGPGQCCFSYQTQPIPVRVITAHEETERPCQKPGVIFTVKEGRKVCADPDVKWVQNLIKKIDKQMYESST